MKTEIKLLKISSIKMDKKLYPRTGIDWTTCARYYNALKSGAEFPPIVVARRRLSYVLIDGAHRLKAFKDAKETHIQVEVLIGLSDKQIYLEAIKRNASHGRQFSTQEVAKITITLKEWNMSGKDISELINIPVDKLDDFIAKRLSATTGGKSEILKAPLKHLAGTLQDENQITEQGVLASRGQGQLLDSVVVMLQNNWFNLESNLVKSKLHKIYKLLIPIFQ